jgi:hypothetical protein
LEPFGSGLVAEGRHGLAVVARPLAREAASLIGDHVPARGKVIVRGVLVVVRASLIAITRRLVVVRPCLILIARRLIGVRRRLIPIGHSLPFRWSVPCQL